jgi:hypothetical protein
MLVGKPPVCALEIGICRVPVDPKQFVIVLGHKPLIQLTTEDAEVSAKKMLYCLFAL